MVQNKSKGNPLLENNVKINKTRPLAENVYNTLLGLLVRRNRPKEWERELLAQAALELEARAPANTARGARSGVYYCLGKSMRVQDETLPVGYKVHKGIEGWRYNLPNDPKWKTRYISLHPDTPITPSAIQER